MTTAAAADVALLDLLPARPLVAASVKVGQSGLSVGRRLYTLPRAAFSPQVTSRFLKTAAAFLGYDAAALRPWLDLSDVFHFGLDPASGTDRHPVRKVYLELTADTPDDPTLTYIALKAEPSALRLNRYHAVPLTTAAEAERLQAALNLAARFQPAARALIGALLAGPGDYPTLMVTEDGTQRRSLDFNFADQAASDQVLAALAQLLADLGQSPAAIDRLLTPSLCHAALGVAADGAAFVTLYGYPEVQND
jgi:hypothetical protein